MKEIGMVVLGLFLFILGFLGFVLSYSVEVVGERIFGILDLNVNVTPSTTVSFILVAISGVMFVSYGVGKGLGWRYRLFAFLGSVLCAVSSAIFFAKTVGLGPDWLGRELVGIGGRNVAYLSLVVTFIPFLSFLSGFAVLFSEMEI